MVSRPVETPTLVTAYVAAKTAAGRSKRTIEGYTQRLGRFAVAWPTLPTTPEPVEAFIAAQGPTNETRWTYYRDLRSFYNWLVRRHQLRAGRNPLTEIEAPIVRPKQARWLDESDLSRLLSHAGHPTPVRALLWLLADTGLRLSEALSIEPASFIGDVVIVTGKVGGRFVPVSPSVRDMVLAVLPWPWRSRRPAWAAINKAFSRAGLATERRSSAITLRHTFGQLWDGELDNLVGIMGHTSPRMVMRTYRPYAVRRAVPDHRKHTPTSKVRMPLF